MNPRFDLAKPGLGLGLRPAHYQDIIGKPTQVDWFEIISENYMCTRGRPRRMLEKVAADYPLVFHGVTLSIGGTDPLDMDYLRQLKELAREFKPLWISDHLCWTGVHGAILHDLLPMPYTAESLRHVCSRIRQVQDVLERPLVLENPSTYLEFKTSEMSEWEFMRHMCEDADCALLLDVNNVYVTCFNHGLDPQEYIEGLPLERVVQIHLAGHSNKGTHIIDTHDDHVIPEVWDLYDRVLEQTGPVATMVEWDDKIPDFGTVQAEVLKAGERRPLRQSALVGQSGRGAAPAADSMPVCYELLAGAILGDDADRPAPGDWIRGRPDMPAEKQLGVYSYAYHARLFDAVAEDYPALRRHLGEDAFQSHLDAYISRIAPTHYDLNVYCQAFAQVLEADPKLAGTAAANVAVLESALARVFHLPVGPVLDAQALRDMPAHEFAASSLRPVEASILLRLDHDIMEFYQSLKAGSQPPEPQRRTSWVLAWQREHRAQCMSMDADEAALFGCLERHASVLEALEAAMAESGADPEAYVAKVQHWFARWGQAGCLAMHSGNI